MTTPRAAQRVVLVADDDPDIRSLVTLRLTRAGYEVIGACDGEEAFALACERRPPWPSSTSGCRGWAATS